MKKQQKKDLGFVTFEMKTTTKKVWPKVCEQKKDLRFLTFAMKAIRKRKDVKFLTIGWNKNQKQKI
jgi:hypothetical protein